MAPEGISIRILSLSLSLPYVLPYSSFFLLRYSLQEATTPRLSGHVTSHLIARGSVLYAVVAYYTTGAGIHTGL